MKKYLLLAAVGVSMTLASASNAATAKFWDVDQGGGTGIPGSTTQTAGNPENNQVDNLADALAIIDYRAADATFDTSGIDYPNGGGANSTSNNVTLENFLGATDWATVVSATVDATTTINASVFEFFGLITLGAGTSTFSVASDDGFLLEIGGTEIARFDGTRAIGSVSNADFDAGAGGQFTYRLVYFEDQNVQAGVYATVNNEIVTLEPVPLPAAGWMLIAGVGGLVAMRRRKKS